MKWKNDQVKSFVRNGSQKTQFCIALKPVNTRDYRDVVQFTVETIGIFTKQIKAADKFLSALRVKAIIKNGARRRKYFCPVM